jgi:hypothetical protein
VETGAVYALVTSSSALAASSSAFFESSSAFFASSVAFLSASSLVALAAPAKVSQSLLYVPARNSYEQISMVRLDYGLSASLLLTVLEADFALFD